MDLRIIFPVLSMLSSGIFDLAAAASLNPGPANSASVSARHSRTKRCSCASFLDKECVYFCHLDIIWVNTPERTVSYGLGNAPRKKRSVTEPDVPKSRCKCADGKDKTCVSYCHPNDALRSEAESDRAIPSAIPSALGHDCPEQECQQNLAAVQKTIKRVRNTQQVGDALLRLRATKKIQKLLEKRQVRQSHRTLSGEPRTSPGLPEDRLLL